MNALCLTLKEPPRVPLEAEVLNPDVLRGKTRVEIGDLAIYLGKRRCRLADWFDIAGDPGDELELRGDLRRVKMIGRGMTRGRIVVHGSVGMHLGAQLAGGTIEVHGDAGDWVGAEMTAGLIRIRGNAGGQIGAAYRGNTTGMRDGTIIVDGSAGLEVGMRMKRGTIVIGGPVRDFAGLQMKGGNLVLRSGAEIRAGAWMTRGTIISLQPLSLLPTFSFACTYQPTFLVLLARQLAPLGIELPVDSRTGVYDLYSGDSSVPGRGEILVWRPPHGKVPAAPI